LNIEPSPRLNPVQRYQADLAKESFRADPAQKEAVAHFQSLFEELLQPVSSPLFWGRLLARRVPPINGLYVWGGPGRGKTYLMDCFYESLPFAEKRRVHFHRFMLEIHAALDALPRTPDPLRIVAGHLASSYRVLCLDEFHVNDIADAMLLGGLLDALFARRMVLVVTSNMAPDALYRDGIQHERFMPAIDLLKAHCRVHWLDGSQDFRLALLQRGGTYRLLDDIASGTWIGSVFAGLIATEPGYDVRIVVHGRDLQARAAADDIVWFDFAALCLMPRSARDYLELAREFHTLLLHGVPCFDEDMDEAARRFMHLIDALYDHNVKLVMTADAEPENLYAGTRLAIAFERTASRLVEMSSIAYLARPHRTD